MQISAKELRHLANDVDDMHHEAMRTFKEEAAELHLGARARAPHLPQAHPASPPSAAPCSPPAAASPPSPASAAWPPHRA